MWQVKNSYFPYYIIHRKQTTPQLSYTNFCKVYESELKDFAITNFGVHKLVKDGQYVKTEKVAEISAPMRCSY